MTKDELKTKVKTWVEENPRTVALIVGAVFFFVLGAVWL